VTTNSPLEELRLVAERAASIGKTGPSISHDNLIYHLARRHSRTLRVLRADIAYVGRSLTALCTKCKELEELGIAVAGRDHVRV
jgi:hypothetical protein